MYIKQFCGFAQASRYRCWLCTWINKRGVWNKRGGWQNSPKLIYGECWVRLGRVTKNGIINKRGVPSIWNSRVVGIKCVFQKLQKHLRRSVILNTLPQVFLTSFKKASFIGSQNMSQIMLKSCNIIMEYHVKNILKIGIKTNHS